MASNKNPFISAVINFLFWGLGYVYYGKRAVFGYIVFTGFIFIHIPLFYSANWLEIPRIFIIIGHMIISFAFAFDIIELARIKKLTVGQIKKIKSEDRFACN